MPHRSGSAVHMQRSEPERAGRDRRGGGVMGGPGLLGHRGSERRRLARVCLCQPERLSRLLGQGRGHN